MGVSHALANGTILFTLGIDNTEADIQVIADNLPQIVERLRVMSPLYQP
jgi:cysteine desulfurase